MASAAYDRDSDGGKIIPASQRPDGTWRKPRRVRDGYVPQEEVPLYESKGKQFAARRSDLPVGLTPEIVAAAKKKSTTHASPIPGLQIDNDKAKKKKKKKTGAEEAAEKIAKISITEPRFSEPAAASCQAEPAKRLKNLKKKLRDIETLEEKIKSGELKAPDKDQLDKISKKDEVRTEIQVLETQCSE